MAQIINNLFFLVFIFNSHKQFGLRELNWKRNDGNWQFHEQEIQFGTTLRGVWWNRVEKDQPVFSKDTVLHSAKISKILTSLK